MFDFILNNSSITNLIGGYGAIVSLIALLGVPIIVLKHIIKQTKFTKLSYIFMSIFLSGFICSWIVMTYDYKMIDIWDYKLYYKLYDLFLYWLVFILLLGIICLVASYIKKKKKLNKKDYILPIIFILLMNSLIARHFIETGYTSYNIKNIEKGINMAIFPFDRQMGYGYLGDYYRILSKKVNSKENLFKAIENYEKALNGNYAKFKNDTLRLIVMYISVQNYEKAIEVINKAEKNKFRAGTFNRIKVDVYILLNKYQEALDSLLKIDYIDEHNLSTISNDLFLISILYDKLGNKEKSNEYRIKALKKFYDLNDKNIDFYLPIILKDDKLSLDNNYQNIENYRKFLQNKYPQVN